MIIAYIVFGLASSRFSLIVLVTNTILTLIEIVQMLRDTHYGTRDLRKMFYIVGNIMIIVYLFGVINSNAKVTVHNNNMSKLIIIVGMCFISIRAVWQLR